MYIDSKVINESWSASESKQLADRLVQDVLRNSEAFTRFVRSNDSVLSPSQTEARRILEKPYIEKQLSLQGLGEKIQDFGDLPKNKDCFLTLLHHDVFLPIAEALTREHPNYVFSRSGLILYKQGNYMGWHTNSTNPINRIYFVYSDKGDSGFVSYDQERKAIHDDKDQQGWNIREFECGDGISDPLYWHGVYSYCNRISIGFRVVPAANMAVSATDAAIQGDHLFENEWESGFQFSTLQPGKRYAIPIRTLQYLLTPDRLQECRFEEIAYKNLDSATVQDNQPRETSLPGIVASGMPNPFGKPYRLIDGNKRVHRLMGEGKVKAQFFVLAAKEVLRHLEVQDIPQPAASPKSGAP